MHHAADRRTEASQQSESLKATECPNGDDVCPPKLKFTQELEHTLRVLFRAKALRKIPGCL
jgi:hypothetical protein